MSSRLFQEVREKRGLAYSVYSFTSQHADTGMWGIYVGCLPAKADEVLAICRDEIAKVVSRRADRRGAGTAARASCAARSCWAWRTPSSRMSRLGKSELVYPQLEPVDEILASIEAVTPRRRARRSPPTILAQPKALAVVGPFDDAASLRRRHCPEARRRRTCPRRQSMIKVGVLGAKGRMGAQVCQAVAGADGPGPSPPRWTRVTTARRWPAATWWSTSPTPAW